MKRDWNASADRLASEALKKEKVGIVIDDNDRQDLVNINRLYELQLPHKTNQRVRVAPIICGKADFLEMVDSRWDGPEGQGPRDRKGTGGQGDTEEKQPLGSSR